MKKLLRIVISLAIASAFSLSTIETSYAGLFSFSSHTFTNCGATGINGPSTANCTSAYSGASWASNSSYFTTSSGIQLWTVPTTGTYRIAAYGAAGGTGKTSHAGGNGAKIQADISLTQGAQLKILVGQMGSNTSNYGGAGGGGGTFVVTSSNDPLIIAGGGGGGGGDSSSGNMVGVDASTGTSGTAARDGTLSGGTSGNGPTTSGAWSGAAGGGFNTNGGSAYNSSNALGNSGGVAFVNGGTGGAMNNVNNYGSVGGFGGGGGASWGAGGGGGYSGGAADYSDGAGNSREGGGGGGSYVSGSNQVLLAGANSSQGYVTIQILVGPPDAPTVGIATMLSPTSASVTFTAPVNNNGDTITAYTVISTPESKTATVSQSTSGTITITGLTPNTTYIFRVYATNSYGDSSYSSPSGSITTTKSPTSITISLPGNGTSATYKTVTTITATVIGTEGKVTFFLNSKRIATCLNKLTTSLVATCSWVPAAHGQANLSATFTPTSAAYLSSNASKSIGVIARSTRR